MPDPCTAVSPPPATATLTPTDFFSRAGSRLAAYAALTQPTLQLLGILTGAAGLVLEGSLVSQPLRFSLVLLLLGLAAASAKALNQYFERDLDRLMERTRRRRPLPSGRLAPLEALLFALFLGSTSIILFWLAFNPLSALLAAGTIFYYSFFYTLYLKRRTPWSIVLGGLAGSMGPVLAWAAAGGDFSPTPFLLLAVVFFWSPPHFWALALVYREDYAAIARYVGMLPLQKGETATWRVMGIYVYLTVAASVSLMLVGAGGLYLAAALLLGLLFMQRTRKAAKLQTKSSSRGLFRFSILYLLALFACLIMDRIF